MKTQKTIRTGMVVGAATMAMLLALGNAYAGKGDNNKGGASIGITNHCALADDAAGKPVLRVTTSIINKSSEDATPYFVENGMIVIGEQKGRGNKYSQVGDTVTRTASLGDPIVTDISLCNDDGSGTNLSADSVSLNATVSIDVINDNKAEYSNRCKDDPSTDGIDEGKVLVSPDSVDAICRLP